MSLATFGAPAFTRGNAWNPWCCWYCAQFDSPTYPERGVVGMGTPRSRPGEAGQELSVLKEFDTVLPVVSGSGTESVTYDEYLALEVFRNGRHNLVRENRLQEDLQLGWSLSMPFEMDDGRIVDGPGGHYRADRRSLGGFLFWGRRERIEPWNDGLYQLDRERLKATWGVTSGASAVNTAWKLILEAGDPGYRVLRPYVQDIVARPRQGRIDRAGELFDDMIRELARQLPGLAAVPTIHRVIDPFIFVDAAQVLPSTLPPDTAAWDTANAVQLLRVSFRAGLVDGKDTEALVRAALNVARQAYRHWREYADDYIIGRAESVGTVDQGAFTERDAVADALHHPLSPWRTTPLHPRVPSRDL